MVEHHCARTRNAHAAAGGDFGGPSARPHYPPDLELEPVHLLIDLQVDLESQTASGSVTLTLEAKVAEANALTLHLVDALEVEVRSSDDSPIRWSYDDRQIEVRWDTPWKAGEQRMVVVTYRLEQPTAGLYFSKPSEAYPGFPGGVPTDLDLAIVVGPP
ncbi:MAG: hypothetical protein AAFS10_13910, partial [Myxococcota bacterium]